MTKFIQLEEMLKYGNVPEDAKLVWDSNVWRYKYKGEAQNVVVTAGVIDELAKFPLQFPEESIFALSVQLWPEVVNYMVSEEYEARILDAELGVVRIREKGLGGIGWVDSQQVGYALQRADEGEKTVLVTEDSDISFIVRELKKRNRLVRENISVLSPSNYITEINKQRLYGLKKFVRIPMKRLIIENYLVAA